MLTYSDNAAFWVFNRVAHFKYLFYNRIIGDIQKVQKELEDSYIQATATLEAGLKDCDLADASIKERLTRFSNEAGAKTVKRWKELDNYLLVKYLDSNIKQEDENGFKTNGYGYPARPMQPGYPDSWKKRVSEETREQFVRPE